MIDNLVIDNFPQLVHSERADAGDLVEKSPVWWIRTVDKYGPLVVTPPIIAVAETNRRWEASL